MDPVKNPYAPGAGTQPPELAGRSQVLETARIAVQRVAAGKTVQAPVLVGLRGVGKTVLLLRIKDIADEEGLEVIWVETSEAKTLPEMLVPGIRAALLNLSGIEAAKAQAVRAFGALRAFMAGFKLSYAGFEISYDVTAGIADSGDIETDLPALFIELGKAAKAARQVVVMFVDELQTLKPQEFSALITAIHRVNHFALPIAFIGAGLPQVVGLAGNSKSYSERLFKFEDIGALSEADAIAAIEHPAMNVGVRFDAGAISQILQATQRYPYFLQQWAYDSWNVARDEKTITFADVLDATAISLRALDDSFFRVRLDRVKPGERLYMRALAELGPGAHRTADVASILGVPVAKTTFARSKLMKKTIIYSPSHGDICFTVPLFDEFMRRTMPEFVPSSR